MNSVFNTLDNITPKKIGENGNVEYTWSNNVRERIAQFSFQLVRTQEQQIGNLKDVLQTILQDLKCRYDKYKDSESAGFLIVLYKLIGSTRDIVDGKGEYLLTYMMICAWYDFYPELADFALKCLFYTDDSITHQYGSWKDIKKFCHFCLSDNGNNRAHPLITTSIDLMNTQLRKDYHMSLHGKYADMSLVSRWVPREKSKYSWLFQLLAKDYFSEYFVTVVTNDQYEKAQKKCYTEYRKLISGMNRKLNTVQIDQCANNWSEIQFNNVTSITFTKQKKAFLNVKNKEPRYPDREDRVKCAENFNTYIQQTLKEGKEIKGKRVGMESFTNQALDLINTPKTDPSRQIQIDLLNSQWRDSSTQTGLLENMVAMVDVSGSMSGDPLNVAVAMGIRIAEHSKLGKRIMTFSACPKWVNLTNYDDFVSQVEVVSKAEWGMNTNLYAAFKLFLDAVIENKLSPEEVQNMIIVILSDMQVDQADDANGQTLHENIVEMYKQTGIDAIGKPYKPPHLVFWNLRSTEGFPTLSTQPNTSMLSGFSPVFLNLFCEQGLEALESITPWAQLERTLSNPRYDIMGNFITDFLVEQSL